MTRTPRPVPASRAKRRRSPRPQLTARHFREHLRSHAATVAPADVRELLSHADDLRGRARTDAAGHPSIARDVALALDLLADHVAGRIDHVPYRGVTLLAAAVLYYLDPMDVIPDFVPGAGTADDALMFELARRDAVDEIARYEAWRSDVVPARRRRRR